MDQQYSLFAAVKVYSGLDQSFDLNAAERQAAWVANLATMAVSRYENFNYNAFALFNGVPLVADRNGIYPLTAKSDQGAPIQARVVTGKMDFGSSFLKCVPYLYTGITGGPLVVTAMTDNGVQQYPVPASASQGSVRAKLALGSSGRYWQFVYANTNGADFTVSHIDILPVQLTRRAR